MERNVLTNRGATEQCAHPILSGAEHVEGWKERWETDAGAPIEAERRTWRKQETGATKTFGNRPESFRKGGFGTL